MSKRPFTPICYKAQWPLSSNMPNPMVLIYDSDVEPQKREHYHLPATPEIKKQLFEDGKYIKVFFLGRIHEKDGTITIDKFVRQRAWL